MKISTIISVVILMLVSITGGYGQALPAAKTTGLDHRILLEVSGGGGGTGFGLPNETFGVSLEIPFKNRFEFQPKFEYSPSPKIVVGNGWSIDARARELFWINHRFGLTGELTYSRTMTSEFTKQHLIPAAGVVIRDNAGEMPGRLYVEYIIPTGSRLVPIQSNRVNGIRGYQEFRICDWCRLGIEFDWYNFQEQSNPLFDHGKGTVINTGYAQVYFKVEFPHHKDQQSEPY